MLETALNFAARIVVASISVALLPWCLTAQTAGNPMQPATLLVVNQADHNLSLVDPLSLRQQTAIDVQGITGHEVAVSPDGKTAYVPIYGDSGVGKPGSDGTTLTVIDIASHTVTGTVEFGHGVRPHCPVYDPISGFLYVTTELDRTISIIDPHNLTIVGTIPTGQPQSHMLALSHSGLRGYTANVGAGTVSVLDMKLRKTLAIIPISGQTQRISISNDDRWVFTADQTKPQLAVIDTATNTLKTWIPLPAIGYGTAPTRDGRWLLVAVRPAHLVAVIDLTTLTVARTIDVPDTPTEILLSPDGTEAYISCGSRIARISLSNWRVDHVAIAGTGSDGLAWAR